MQGPSEDKSNSNLPDEKATDFPPAPVEQAVTSSDLQKSVPVARWITMVRKEEVEMSEELVIKMTRKQLYDEIWQISVAGLARKYDVPYSQVMKQIKESAIPIPPSGYWVKLSHGKPTTKPELPGPADAVLSIQKAVQHTRVREKEVELPVEKDEKRKPQLANSETASSDDHPTIEKTALPVTETVVSTVPEEPDFTVASAVSELETYTQYGQTYNVYHRDTLYKEVWEVPVTEVAKRYKVSDVAIHKVCKSLEIPTPPLGYWARLRAGKPVSVIPLPRSDKGSQKTGIQTGTTYQPEAKTDTLTSLSEEDRSIILAVASQILLPDEQARMNPQIVAHRKAVAEWKKQKNYDEIRGWGKRNAEPAPYLADTISDASLPRACRIIDALIKAMEPLGCSLTSSLCFVVNKETVQLSFSETKDEVKHIPSKEENIQLLKYEEDRKRYSWASKPQIRKYDHVFSGRLSLSVKKSYRDCKSYVLEDRLGDIMIELYQVAEDIKRDRQAREEAERKRKEDERRKEERRKLYNLEVDRALALTNLAEDYDIACKIRRYIAVVEASGVSDEKTTEWIEWAKAKADWYDPTVARKDDFFGERDHEKDAAKKKLDHIGYWW